MRSGRTSYALPVMRVDWERLPAPKRPSELPRPVERAERLLALGDARVLLLLGLTEFRRLLERGELQEVPGPLSRRGMPTRAVRERDCLALVAAQLADYEAVV